MIGARDPMGLIGQTLDGQFRVDEFVGEGGFSVVYRGYHTGLGEIIAIKCLKLQSQLGSALVESFVRRFRDEGRILYRLSQGNLHIVRSIASGTTIAGTTGSLVPYTVLEWLEGHSLMEDFERRRAASMHGRSLREAATLFSTAFEAVADAHEAGVVHRDLNPGNIFLTQTREGVRAKVLDFGVAKIVSDHALEMGPRAQTLGQIRMFSPAYAAPEQFDERLGKMGPWTDVYTLSLVFLEALRDQPPVLGDNLAALVAATLDEAKRPTPRSLGLEVSDEVEKVFARAFAFKPEDRQESVGQLWTELAAALGIRNIALSKPMFKTPPPGQVAPQPPPRPAAFTQTVRMESPFVAPPVRPASLGLGATLMMPNPMRAPSPSSPQGAASTPTAADLEGRFSATMLAPENMHPAQAQRAPLPSEPQGSNPQVASSPYGPMPPVNVAPSPVVSSTSLGRGDPESFQSSDANTDIVRLAPSKAPLVIGVLLGVFLAAAGLVVLVLSLRGRMATHGPSPVTTSTATASALVTATPLSLPPTMETAIALPPATAVPMETAMPTATGSTGTTATATGTTTTASATTASASTRPVAVDPNAFDAKAADRALSSMDAILVSCSEARGEKGVAHVTFANDGSVQAVAIDPPFAGSAGATCVASRYKLARTSKFEGSPATVTHSFKVAK
ncbi:MAG: protein kinase [Polyangiaceae bacterium]